MFSVPFYRVLVLCRLWTLSYGVIPAENKLSVTKVNRLQITKRNEVISRQIPRGMLFKQYRSRWERYRNPTETSPAENLEKPFEPQASRFERPIRPRSVTILGLSTRQQSRKGRYTRGDMSLQHVAATDHSVCTGRATSCSNKVRRHVAATCCCNLSPRVYRP